MGDEPERGPIEPAPAGVERLLAELADLRLLLDSDLTIAAAALDADAPGMASQIIGDEHERLNSLQARILRGVTPRPEPAVALVAQRLPLARRFANHLPAGATAALAAAAVAAVVLGGASVIPTGHGSRPALAADVANATDSYDAFSRIATSKTGVAADVEAAAAALHASLQPLIDAAGSNPESAQRALELLQAEQLLLLQSKPAGANAILREAHRLVLRLRSQAPSVVPPAATRPLATASPKPAAKTSAKPTTKASPSPSPSASPATKPSPKPKPSTSPSPSPSSSPTGIIPGV
jgi:hypothetical protein